MAKKMGIGAPPGKRDQAQTVHEQQTVNTQKRDSRAEVDLNFKVSAEFRREFKTWAAAHDMSQKAVLEAAFDLLKKSHI